MSNRKIKWEFEKRTCGDCGTINSTREEGDIVCRNCKLIIKVNLSPYIRYKNVELRKSLMENAPLKVKKMWETARNSVDTRKYNYNKEYCKRPEVKTRLKKYHSTEKYIQIQRKSQKKYYENNKDKIRERNKKWIENNRDKCRERAKKYYNLNKEKMRKYKREYYQKNKDKYKKYSRDRYWRKKYE